MATSNSITYKQLDEVLVHLGFDRQRVQSKWLRYEHPASQTVIVLAAKKPNELVRVTEAISARRHLVEKGIIGEEEIEALFSGNSTLGKIHSGKKG